MAAASRIPGSVVHDLVDDDTKATLSIGHPSGVMHVRVKSKPANNEERVEFETLGFGRTARRIMEGMVYVPTSDDY